MKFARFDVSGSLIARYDSNINDVLVDGDLRAEFADLVPMSDEVFARSINESDGVWKLDPQSGEIYKGESPAPTIEEIKLRMLHLVQVHMDTAARARGYDSLLSAVSYADEPAVEQFQNEGQAFRAWRSLVWASCYSLLAEVLAEQREIPSDSELLDLLPELVL